MGFFFEKNCYPFLLLQNTIKMRPPARIAPKKKKKITNSNKKYSSYFHFSVFQATNRNLTKIRNHKYHHSKKCKSSIFISSYFLDNQTMFKQKKKKKNSLVLATKQNLSKRKKAKKECSFHGGKSNCQIKRHERQREGAQSMG